MKVFVAIFALLAAVSASPLYLASAPLNLQSGVLTQYHSQDGIGHYAYGYNDPLSNKHEVKSLDGTTKGSYSYIDSNNILQTVHYAADANGFQVTASNLPKPVEAQVFPAHELPQQVPDTLEVAAAKSAHLAAIEEAKQGLNGQQIVPVVVYGLPQQVQDTPEVAAARDEHLAAIEAAKNQVLVIPTPIELPRPVEDTPEVAKAKAEHLWAIEKAKLTTSPIELPVSSQGFSYSTSVVNAPVSNYAYYRVQYKV